MTIISAQVPMPLKRDLERLAERDEEWTLSTVVRRALRDYVRRELNEEEAA